MPVSRVHDAGSPDCQLSNGARISQKMPVSLKNMTELDYINLDSIELKLCCVVTNVVVTNVVVVFFFFFFFFYHGEDFSLSIPCGGIRSCH